jgi:hypothetical protein
MTRSPGRGLRETGHSVHVRLPAGERFPCTVEQVWSVQKEPRRIVMDQLTDMLVERMALGVRDGCGCLIDQGVDIIVGVALPPRSCNTAVQFFTQDAVGTQR